LNTICFGGFAGSGGSVIRDIFNEFDGVHLFPNEFRLIKERYGILDLERAIFEDKSPENIDIAIKDFIWLTQNMDFPHSRFSRIGNHYSTITNDQFIPLTEEYIKSIVGYEYSIDCHFLQFKKNHFQQITHRFKKKFNLASSLPKAYYVAISQNEFTSLTKKYISQIIISSSKSNFNVVALHNAIPPFGGSITNRALKYFDNVKLIIVDRDPRDIFLDLPNNKYLPNSDDVMKKAKGFVAFSKKQREDARYLNIGQNVLFLRFEDLVLDYENALRRIINFTDSELGNHNKLCFFNPDISKVNVYKWHNAPGSLKKALEYIATELPDNIYR
jgi:hypothetical protein